MLSQKTRVSVIIPTYNEKDTIGELISHIEKYRETFDLSLIIIDDESMDGTREIVSKYCGIYPNLHIIVRRNQRGLGSAILDGFRFALNETPKPEYILTMDADLSHDPSEIPSMVKTCSFGSIVIGSRYTEWGEHRRLEHQKKVNI